MSVIDTGKLEKILQTNWAEYMDTSKVIQMISNHVRDTDFPVLYQAGAPKRHTKMSVTNVSLINRHLFESWLEFTVPKDRGVVIGTVIMNFDLLGFAEITDSFGSEFRLENLKQHPES